MTASALRVAAALDAVTRSVGRTIAWLIVPMVGSLVWEVVARYFFNAPTEWAYDMTFMLYGTFFMIGSAWTLQRGGHIRTDIYYARWSPRTRARIDLASYLTLFFPALAVFTWLTWAYFWRSFELNERIVTSPWLPHRVAVQAHDARSRRVAAAAGRGRIDPLRDPGLRSRDRR